jgi:hypothetical protein
MNKVINSNCKSCPDHLNNKCEGSDNQCMCKFCPRNLGLCVRVKWCRETESPVIFD